MLQIIKIQDVKFNIKEIISLCEEIKYLYETDNDELFIVFSFSQKQFPFSFEDFINILNDLEEIQQSKTTYVDGSDNKVLQKLKQIYIDYM